MNMNQSPPPNHGLLRAFYRSAAILCFDYAYLQPHPQVLTQVPFQCLAGESRAVNIKAADGLFSVFFLLCFVKKEIQPRERFSVLTAVQLSRGCSSYLANHKTASYASKERLGREGQASRQPFPILSLFIYLSLFFVCSCVKIL